MRELHGAVHKFPTFLLGLSDSLPNDAFMAVDANREGCASGLPNGIHTCATQLLSW